MLNFLTLFDDSGKRVTSIPMDSDLTIERKNELIEQGYVEIDQEEWNFYIGNCGNGKNGTGYIRGADGKPTDAPPLDISIIRQDKIMELKIRRDDEEVKDIIYNGTPFDYDIKSRERLNIAERSLGFENAPESILWTAADNTHVALTLNDFRMINMLAAERSKSAHMKYNILKQKVNAATSEDEVNSIIW